MSSVIRFAMVKGKNRGKARYLGRESTSNYSQPQGEFPPISTFQELRLSRNEEEDMSPKREMCTANYNVRLHIVAKKKRKLIFGYSLRRHMFVISARQAHTRQRKNNKPMRTRRRLPTDEILERKHCVSSVKTFPEGDYGEDDDNTLTDGKRTILNPNEPLYSRIHITPLLIKLA